MASRELVPGELTILRNAPVIDINRTDAIAIIDDGIFSEDFEYELDMAQGDLASSVAPKYIVLCIKAD